MFDPEYNVIHDATQHKSCNNLFPRQNCPLGRLRPISPHSADTKMAAQADQAMRSHLCVLTRAKSDQSDLSTAGPDKGLAHQALCFRGRCIFFRCGLFRSRGFFRFRSGRFCSVNRAQGEGSHQSKHGLAGKRFFEGGHLYLRSGQKIDTGLFRPSMKRLMRLGRTCINMRHCGLVPRGIARGSHLIGNK